MPFVTFVLSTGRCGTQWLAHHLSAAGAPALSVDHEPLDNSYHPRLMIGVQDPASLEAGFSAPILAHADEIERRLDSGSHVECGHPCWSTIPWFARRFAGRVRVIHLTRHPVPTACSWLTHQAYCPPFLPHLQEKVLLSPFDAGVRFPEYQEVWPSLTPYEKALYYWTEINAFGLALEQNLGVPWLRLKYEELFGGNGIAALHDFLGLPPASPETDDRRTQVDQYRYLAAGLDDWQAITRHPRTLHTSQQLGYDPLSVNASALQQRYLDGRPIFSSPV